MKLCKVCTTHHRSWLGQVKEIYEDAFPQCERRPWESVERLVDSDSGKFTMYVSPGENDAVEAFITVWRLGTCCYIEHFAVSEQLRSRGYGTDVLRALLASIPEGYPVVLEVEPADTHAMARRRIAFYTRAGFTPHPAFEYVQPPYAPGLPPVKLMLMSALQPLDESRLRQCAADIHTEVYAVAESVNAKSVKNLH